MLLESVEILLNFILCSKTGDLCGPQTRHGPPLLQKLLAALVCHSLGIQSPCTFTEGAEDTSRNFELGRGLHLHFQAAQFLLDLLSFLLALSQRKASRRPARAGTGCLSLSLPGMEAGQSLRASCPPEVVAHWFPLSLSLSRRPRIAPCVVNSHEISVVRALPAALPAALEHAADRHPHNTSTRFQANYHLDRFRKSAASSSLLPVSTCSRNSSNNGAVPGLCFHCERAC